MAPTVQQICDHFSHVRNYYCYICQGLSALGRNVEMLSVHVGIQNVPNVQTQYAETMHYMFCGGAEYR